MYSTNIWLLCTVYHSRYLGYESDLQKFLVSEIETSEIPVSLQLLYFNKNMIFKW